MMNRFLTLLLAASCLTAVGQVTYPYNPDGNADGDIAVGDLQDFLVTYGNPFSPSEIMVGDSSLTYWVEQLSQTIQEQQEIIEGLRNFSSLSRTLEYPQGQFSSEYIQFTCVGEDPYIVPNGKTLLIEEEEYYSSPAINPLSARIWLNGEPIETRFGGIDKRHFNAGDTLYFTELDSVRCFAFLLPEDAGIDYLHLSLLDRKSFTVPEDKTFLLKSARFYNPMFSGSYGDVEFSIDGEGWWTPLFGLFQTWTNWFSPTTESQLNDSQILSDWNSFPAGTTIRLENDIEQNEYTYFFLHGYLIDDNYFGLTPSISEESEGEEPAEDNLGPCQGEFTVNYHGYDYELVEIGDQCWFADNCRFLPSVSPMELGLEDDGASHAYVYDFNSSDLEAAKATFFYESLGVLYNLLATTSWNICPNGWRIPSFLDWQELDAFTGSIDEHTLYRNGLNYSGLSIDFGGDRNTNFGDLMTDGWYWLGDPLPSEGNVIRFSQNESFKLSLKPPYAGCSARCIKDAE